MSMPFYVAPEQVMKDRADYARKGIARGRAAVAVRYRDGVALVAENTSNTLRKISEIYDRIAFAGVGRYNEFDQLRVAGVRAADLKGFQYSREDVDARSLANQYAAILGQIFTHEMKPMEVEILVAEVGLTADGDNLFHILYDGTVMDERQLHRARWRRRGDRRPAARVVRRATSRWTPRCASPPPRWAAPDRTLTADDLEVAVLERTNGRRCFRRATDDDIAGYLAGTATAAPVDADDRRAAGAGRTAGRQPRRLTDCRRWARVDLNSDVGEGFGAWPVGPTTSCSASSRRPTSPAGSTPATRRSCGRRARWRWPTAWRSARRSAIRTWPGFGRRFIDIAPAELTDAVLYQIGALDAFARTAGGRVAYVKPHGALYNAIVHHEAQAAAVVAALGRVGRVAADARAARTPWCASPPRDAGVPFVAEGFADRGYAADGTLLRRGTPGALLTDPDAVAVAGAARWSAEGVGSDLRAQRHARRRGPGRRRARRARRDRRRRPGVRRAMTPPPADADGHGDRQSAAHIVDVGTTCRARRAGLAGRGVGARRAVAGGRRRPVSRTSSAALRTVLVRGTGDLRAAVGSSLLRRAPIDRRRVPRRGAHPRRLRRGGPRRGRRHAAAASRTSSACTPGRRTRSRSVASLPASPTSPVSRRRCSCPAGRRPGRGCRPARWRSPASLAAVYPTASPGGWHLLGRTDLTLFDVDRDPPALLGPGTVVRFVPQ